jgi:putative oxidoreductase
MRVLHALGRTIVGGYFLYNGINHLQNTAMLAQYASSKQVPEPELAVKGSGALLLAGGAALVLGLQKPGGALTAAFLLGVTPMMHDFWRASDPNQKINDLIHFSKNVALLGAVLALAGEDCD